MRTTQQPSSVLTVSISLRHTTPSLLTTSVLVMCTTSLSSQSMELARERAVLSLDVPNMVTCKVSCNVSVGCLFTKEAFTLLNIHLLDFVNLSYLLFTSEFLFVPSLPATFSSCGSNLSLSFTDSVVSEPHIKSCFRDHCMAIFVVGINNMI